MSKLLKLLKKLKAKGFATSVEKSEVQALLKELSEDEQEVVQDQVEEVETLPEEAPKSGENENEDELEKNIKTILKGYSQNQKQEIVAEIKSEFKAWAEKNMEAMRKEFGTFHPEIQKSAKRKAINSYIRKAFTSVYDGNLAALKEMTTDANGSPYGGYAVDSELNAEISHLITEYGVARREFNAVQLSKNSYAKNSLATDVTVNWIGEATAMGSTQIVLGQGSFELNKLYAIVTLTRELLEDEEIDLFAFIGQRVAEGFARKEDNAFFCGEGTGDTTNGGYWGILNVAGTNPVAITVRGNKDGTSFEHLHADDLLNMQDACPQAIARNGKYYMHRSIRNIIRKLKDDDGAPIYQSPSETGPATIWGRPVVEVEAMPSKTDNAADTPFVVYGDLKISSLFGYKGGTAADMFDAGVVRNVANDADINLITTDRKAIRWIERVGALHVYPKAVAVLSTNSGS